MIDSFDGGTGTGIIRAANGRTYPFARASVVRRSREPRASARAVFRLKDGRVFKMAVGPDQGRRSWTWDMKFWPWNWLLYIP